MTETTVARLPERARSSFKEPLGPVFTDALDLLDAAGEPLIAVGDVVTAHLGDAGVTPHVAVVDGKTERETVDAAVTEAFERAKNAPEPDPADMFEHVYAEMPPTLREQADAFRSGRRE